MELAGPIAILQRRRPERRAGAARGARGAIRLRSLASQREALIEQEKASRARYYPKLSVNGDYGALGTAHSMAGIGEIQGTVSVTLFDWDRSGRAEGT